jgi:hypothetical protein
MLFIINGQIERYKEDRYMIVGEMKDQKVRGLHVSHTLDSRGTGTPKDQDEVNGHVCECQG